MGTGWNLLFAGAWCCSSLKTRCLKGSRAGKRQNRGVAEACLVFFSALVASSGFRNSLFPVCFQLALGLICTLCCKTFTALIREVIHERSAWQSGSEQCSGNIFGFLIRCSSRKAETRIVSRQNNVVTCRSPEICSGVRSGWTWTSRMAPAIARSELHLQQHWGEPGSGVGTIVLLPLCGSASHFNRAFVLQESCSFQRLVLKRRRWRCEP